MGSKISLSSAFSASTGKFLLADPILPLSGAVLLIDATHSLGGFGSGVPALGDTIPNVAWDQAAALVGSGTQSTLSPRVAAGVLGSTNGSTTGTGIERTTKGGLHIAVRQDTISAGVGRRIIMGLPGTPLIKNYLNTRLVANDSIYVSIWQKITRVASIQPSWPIGGFIDFSNGGNYFAAKFQNNGIAFAGAGTSEVYGGSDNTVANLFKNVNCIGYGNPLQNGLDEALLAWGATSYGYNSLRSGTPGANQSYVVYRAYVENLTVSGRSYATVEAIDKALFTAAFASGGRFYNDTYTDPATLAGA